MRQFLAQWGGPIAFAVGLLASLDGRWAVAVLAVALGALLMWLGGGWALPGSTDAYMRRVSRVFSDWHAYEHWVEGRGAPERVPAAPSELRADHERLVGLSAEYTATWADADPLPDRVRRVIAVRRASSDLFAAMGARATSSAARAYITEWEAVRDARHEYDARQIADFEATAESTARRLERIRPPAEATTEHAALVQTLRDHGAAGRELHDAILALDPDRAAAAATAWEAVGRDMQYQGHRIAASLGRGDTWPAPDDA